MKIPNLQEGGFASLLTPEVTEKLQQKKTVESVQKKKGLLDTVSDFFTEPSPRKPTDKERTEQGIERGKKLRAGVSSLLDTVTGEGIEEPTYNAYNIGFDSKEPTLQRELSEKYGVKDAETLPDVNGVVNQFTSQLGWEQSPVEKEFLNILDDKEAVTEIEEAANDESMWEEALGYLGYGADTAKELWSEYVSPYTTQPIMKGLGLVGDGIGYVNDRVDLLTMLSAGAKAGYESNNAGVGALVGLGKGVNAAQAKKAGEASAVEEQRRRSFDENMKEREVLVKEQGLLGAPELSTSERSVVSTYAEDMGVDGTVVNQAAMLIKQGGGTVTPTSIQAVVNKMVDAGLVKDPLLFGNKTLID